MATLNEVFSKLSVHRRYEVWFVRLGLADNSGAWWFRYLLMNPARGGCVGNPRGSPVQVWATWFPKDSSPESFIEGFPVKELDISGKAEAPFHFRIRENAIEDSSCRGKIRVNGHTISWKLNYQSTFGVTLSGKGWIGFSRTPHSDAVFSGEITLDGRRFAADPLGFGVQGHNCGYRHRNFWTWSHAYFLRPGHAASTLEALVYEMPFGLRFCKAVFWHDGQQYVFRDLHETGNSRESLQWHFRCFRPDGLQLEAAIDGRGASNHRLSYVKTNCSGSFEVANNSLASATVRLESRSGTVEKLETNTGAVLEMVG